MKKVLALVLAVTVVLAGNVWAFAETTTTTETAPITIQKYVPGTGWVDIAPGSTTPLEDGMSINFTGSITRGWNFKSAYEVDTVKTEKAELTATLKSCEQSTSPGEEGIYKGIINIKAEGKEEATVDDVGKNFYEDVLIVTLKNDPAGAGKEYKFNIHIVATADVTASNYLSITNNGEDDYRKLYLGLENVIYFDGTDKAGLMANNDYTVEVQEVNSNKTDCIKIGEVVKNGSKFALPVTPTKEITNAGYNFFIKDKDGKQIFGMHWGFSILPASEAPEGFGGNKPTTPENPEDPKDPTDPENPSKPTDPENPSKPTDPENPSKPTDPENPGKPTDPENPGKPDDKPTTPGTSDTTDTKESSRTEQKTDNTRAEEAAMDAVKDANDGKTGRVQTYATAAGVSVPAVPVKLYGLGASLSVDTMETLAAGKTGLNVNLDNGSAGVLIPAGFQMPAGTGVLGYSLGWQKDPLYTNLMKSAVKENNAKTEVYKLGGGTLPTTATVTIKTKLTGKVNVYHWNEDTRKATLIASPTAENGKVTFAAKQLGNLILTTGTI